MRGQASVRCPLGTEKMRRNNDTLVLEDIFLFKRLFMNV